MENGMQTFRIDESGYTGFDLLNDAQRFQGASAVAIDDDSAARLIKEHFPKLQATELKYRALSRREGNHPRLLGLMKDILSTFPSVTYVCDKRFMLSLMFVDYAVEPFYYDMNGPDLYVDGANYSMASLLHVAGPTLIGREPFDVMMAAFQAAMKHKTPQSLSHLVAAARATNWREIGEVLGPLADLGYRGCLEAIATPGVSTDLAIVVLQSLISRMEVMAPVQYRVEHDQSKNLATYHELIEWFIGHDADVEFRASEIASLKFPLKLTDVVQVDSKVSPAVQLADVMIGAVIEATNTLAGQRSGGLDPDALMALYSDDQIIHLGPSLDFQASKAFRRGNQMSAMIDYMARNIPRSTRT